MSGWEKLCDGLEKVGDWCKEHWKEIVLAIEIIVAVTCLFILGLHGIGTGILIGILKGAISGAIIGGIASWASGGSILDGMIDGALGGAMFGGLFGGFGAAGSLFGATSSKMCSLINGFEKVASVTGKMAGGMAAFDLTALGLKVLKKGTGYSNTLFDAIVSTNDKCHSSTIYNVSQTLLSLTAITTGSAANSARFNGNTCFIAGTLVVTVNGLAAIETIKAGDYVLSTDLDKMETKYKQVLETYIRKVDRLIHLIISGEEIITTVDHPFYVQGRGFIEAGSLLVGDKLISVNGNNLLIEDYRMELTEESILVYNFQVEDFHTYHVGKNGFLVHNADYQEVNPKDLEPTHNQTKSNRQMNKLIDQIRQDGIKEPIKYVIHNGIKYVVDGHHRLIAAKRLGLGSVPVEEVELPYGGYKSIDDLNYDIY